MSGPAGIVLFAHGSRDPRWAEPFERLREKLGAQRPDAVVRLAFLELMTPSLGDAVAELAAQGCRTVTVVPVFLGQGGHVRRDLPVLVEACRQAHAGLTVRVSVPVGEDDTVLQAIVAFCASELDRA
ncbi:CbiX/SirB N-terminal domain-containing protein [Pandoraea nosoerga]|uniref:Cobalamin biosynthesis protein CbiX n=1 Tax=Pandoraea nosoerga TaxID=2508296 RepID=A0A5E4WPI6_9BURK|nr:MULTISPECIES: CbiX/SirB N-terminal domain-containing protein [Pandoraea]MBN4666905.1 CbiX/SirB N-terminal domain-containing protein [Pandoraea nosoerga]MBN4677036.1 CbiX/SirB N-terminal domain-containing protein [Pandoraea nosoerga]MBN4681705.1 CbiX/SirB N-terminal domain-containing protein [Pandoraea nosoerga]MBN4744931.1 CbiX/SirB N-terminal domain-containing protein [Pandoraea nosoerga]VVE24926.1 cobalamin biosynthesis protein CbiX [Pandoraea nosoerga]